MKKIILLVGLGLFFAWPGLAAEYYIDATSGNDTDLGSETAPWKTLSMITGASINSGDTVYLKGDFTPSTAVLLDSTIQGTDYQNHTIITNWEGESPSIKLDATLTNGMFYVTGNNYTFSGLEFHNNGTYLASTKAINVQASQQYINIENCTFRDAEDAVVTGATISFMTIEESTFYNNDDAIYFYSGENLTVTSNTLYGNTSRTIMVVAASTNNLFANNIVYNNTGAVGVYPGSITTNVAVLNNTLVNNNYGVACEGYGDGVIIKNNIIAQSVTAATAHYEISPMVYDYNIYYNNANIAIVISGPPLALTTYSSLSDWQALGFDENSGEGDSLLDADYHLQVGSPAIDAGLDVSDWIDNDFDGDDRPWGSAFDIGADEYKYLDAPTNPVLTLRKIYKADLSWDVVDQATSYAVRYRKASETNYETVNSTANTIGLTDLKHAGKYYWQVKAVNGTVESDWSNQKRVITYPRKIVKSEFSIVKAKKKKVRIRINSMKKRITGFNIIVAQKKNGSYKKVKTVKVSNKNDKTYTYKWVEGLKPGTMYRIRIKARRKVGSKKFLSQNITSKYFTTFK